MVRVFDNDRNVSPDRRTFLRLMAVQGASIPAAHLLLNAGGAGLAGEARAATPQTGSQGKSAIRPSVKSADVMPIVRDFADPYIELIRLLREATEVEHALMLQYLYAAFSLKPAYEDIIGSGDPNSNDLLGVAVQEMQHLGKVNQFLVALGATPNLIRQDFPYEPDIYPFEFTLEPLSPNSLAKYVYTEAAVGSLQRKNAKSLADRNFLDRLDRELGSNVRPNHIGSFYDVLIRTLEQVIAEPKNRLQPLPNLKPWVKELEKIKFEGEVGHFEFFKRLFMGTHEGFKGRPNIWDLPPDHPAYPAQMLPRNPSAYVGHPNQIGDPVALSIAWLGNLHYWLTLSFLTFAYKYEAPRFIELAKQHMMGPLLSIARHLPSLGTGFPFDPLSMGCAPGKDSINCLYIFIRMLNEADRLARKLGDRLPDMYPAHMSRETLQDLQRQLASRGNGFNQVKL